MITKPAHRSRLVGAALIACAALGLTACTSSVGGVSNADVSTVGEAFASSVDEAVASAMEQSGSTEAVVGIWSADGEYVRGYGDGVDAATQFRGAQATQPVMCALLLDLVEEGRVDLDREVADDLTRQAEIEGITYEQLCRNTSGLADYKKRLSRIFANNPTRVWPDQELLAQGLAGSPLEWPGLDFHQADTNAVLLGRALQVETREDMPDLLRERVFKAAGMGSSYYPAPGANTISGDALTGLTYPVKGGDPVCDVDPVQVDEVSPTMLSGAGATVTTVADLKAFYESYIGGAFGGDAAGVVTDEIPTKNPKRDDDGEPTEELDTEGRQWTFGVEKIGPMYGRSGAITGTISAAYHDPASGYTVVVALNNSSATGTFSKALALELAAISADAGSGPEVTWSVEDQQKALKKAAVCQ